MHFKYYAFGIKQKIVSMNISVQIVFEISILRELFDKDSTRVLLYTQYRYKGLHFFAFKHINML